MNMILTRMCCLFLALLLTGCSTRIPASNLPATEPAVAYGSLAGFKYETYVENASPDATSLPIVIALHWSSSSPSEFRPYVSGTGVPVRLVLPRGRHARPSQYAFLDATSGAYFNLPPDAKRQALAEESDRFAAFVDAVVRKYPTATKPIIVGASQGGDLAYAMVVRHGDRIHLAIPLLGWVDDRMIPDQPVSGSRPAVRIFHGERDTIIAVASARSHVMHLVDAGYDASLQTYPGVGHEVPEAMQADVVAQIRQALLAE